MNALTKLKTRLNQVADLNGDGKVDKADVASAVARIEAEAGELVSKRGALQACLVCAGGGAAIGAIAVTLLG